VPVDREIYLLIKHILGCECPLCPLSIRWRVKGIHRGWLEEDCINKGAFPVFLYEENKTGQCALQKSFI